MLLSSVTEPLAYEPFIVYVSKHIPSPSFIILFFILLYICTWTYSEAPSIADLFCGVQFVDYFFFLEIDCIRTADKKKKLKHKHSAKYVPAGWKIAWYDSNGQWKQCLNSWIQRTSLWVAAEKWRTRNLFFSSVFNMDQCSSSLAPCKWHFVFVLYLNSLVVLLLDSVKWIFYSLYNSAKTDHRCNYHTVPQKHWYL